METEKYKSKLQLTQGLVVADLFQRYTGLNAEDSVLCKEGIDLAWKWLSGEDVDPYSLCDYVDGEVNLPIRSLDYEDGSLERDIIVTAFLAIGLVAYEACEKSGVMATEGVENFGSNEKDCLLLRIDRLCEEDLDAFKLIEERITTMSENECMNHNGIVRKEDIFTNTSREIK
jgi:hypothetical protein